MACMPLTKDLCGEIIKFHRGFTPDLPLDRGILMAVFYLRKHGIETFESCEGGPGHPFPEPTVRFYGEYSEGFRALSVALMYNLPVYQLRRVYAIENREVVGPNWEITFSCKIPCITLGNSKACKKCRPELKRRN